MEELVAGVDGIRFDVDADMEQQQGAQLLHFPELGAAVREFFTRGLSTRGECRNEDCPFPHVDATAGTTGCPSYDRGFCRHGPLRRYKHTQRVMCANYLVGFCPDGPKCNFMQGESGCKDVSPAEPLLLVTSTTQSLAVQPRNPSNGPPILQCPPEPGICFKCRQKGHYVGKCGKNQMEILLRKRALSQGKQKEDAGRHTT